MAKGRWLADLVPAYVWFGKSVELEGQWWMVVGFEGDPIDRVVLENEDERLLRMPVEQFKIVAEEQTQFCFSCRQHKPCSCDEMDKE